MMSLRIGRTYAVEIFRLFEKDDPPVYFVPHLRRQRIGTIVRPRLARNSFYHL